MTKADVQEKERMTKADIQTIVGRNLSKLIEVSNLSQAKLAKMLDISEAALSGYRKGKGLPSVDFFVRMMEIEELKKYNINIDSFLTKPCRFSEIPIRETIVEGQEYCDDFIGSYLLYYYDTSKRESENLNYGILSLYEEFSNTGRKNYNVVAWFGCDNEKAINLKNSLDQIQFDEESERGNNPSPLIKKNIIMTEKYEKAIGSSDPLYVGKTIFTPNSIYLDMYSPHYNDNASITLYMPHKKIGEEYIGGLGNVSSVSRGRYHLPTLQRIILSRYNMHKLFSQEKLGELLSLRNVNLSYVEEAQHILDLYKKLYSTISNDIAINYLDDDDKNVILERRIQSVLKNKYNTDFMKASYITYEDDSKCYSMIKDVKYNRKVNKQ